MKYKKVFRSAVMTALLLVVISLALCVTASAGGSYSIHKLDINVALQPDGSANISEKWSIEYEDYNGSFSQFDHGFLKKLPKIQQYGELVAHELRINGETVPIDTSKGSMTACIDSSG